METLKYSVIQSQKQYKKYCEIVYSLLDSKKKNKEINKEIDLLTVLIEKWDREHTIFTDLNPIELLKALMDENNVSPNDLSKILGVSKAMVSEILNYHKGLSKHAIQALASHFKVSQEAFNRDYTLVTRNNNHSIASNDRLEQARKAAAA